jgi:DNA-directed RNA polymerase specialized sigma24 family protein
MSRDPENVLLTDDINQEEFDQLLAWLGPDREQSAQKYEWIRKRLIKIFVSRGSHTPDDLADATINRVAKKLTEIRDTFTGDPAHYFSGVAGFIWRESLRKDKPRPILPANRPDPPSDYEEDFLCLDQCLDKLPRFERDLVIAYYQEEKHAKIENRKNLASEMGLALNALRIRACRIRANLMKCVELCRAGGKAG